MEGIPRGEPGERTRRVRFAFALELRAVGCRRPADRASGGARVLPRHGVDKVESPDAIRVNLARYIDEDATPRG